MLAYMYITNYYDIRTYPTIVTDRKRWATIFCRDKRISLIHDRLCWVTIFMVIVCYKHMRPHQHMPTY